MKIIKYNKPFPYRQLREIFTLKEIEKIFNDTLIYTHSSYKKINRRLSLFFYMRYGKRYPYEQDKEYLHSLILQLKDTYIDTFYNNILRTLGVSDLSIQEYRESMLKGNSIKYGTKSGSSSSPYNIAFNKIDSVLTDDNLFEKRLSETDQNMFNNDLVKRSYDIMSSKLNGEVLHFIDSFYSLFSQLDINEYIEKELSTMIELYKPTINNIIDCYNELLPTIDRLRKENNE